MNHAINISRRTIMNSLNSNTQRIIREQNKRHKEECKKTLPIENSIKKTKQSQPQEEKYLDALDKQIEQSIRNLEQETGVNVPQILSQLSQNLQEIKSSNEIGVSEKIDLSTTLIEKSKELINIFRERIIEDNNITLEDYQNFILKQLEERASKAKSVSVVVSPNNKAFCVDRIENIPVIALACLLQNANARELALGEYAATNSTKTIIRGIALAQDGINSSSKNIIVVSSGRELTQQQRRVFADLLDLDREFVNNAAEQLRAEVANENKGELIEALKAFNPEIAKKMNMNTAEQINNRMAQSILCLVNPNGTATQYNFDIRTTNAEKLFSMIETAIQQDLNTNHKSEKSISEIIADAKQHAKAHSSKKENQTRDDTIR